MHQETRRRATNFQTSHFVRCAVRILYSSRAALGLTGRTGTALEPQDFQSLIKRDHTVYTLSHPNIANIDAGICKECCITCNAMKNLRGEIYPVF
jgi:hypothetical protein